jgi:xylulokinase
MGERSPHNNPLARATFTGMTMDSTRTDMTQAVLEGVAFAIRDSFEVAKGLGINITETRMCGGGAKSELWCRIMANVLGIKVDLLKSEEGPSMGAAMLAMVAAGEYGSVKEAADNIVKICKTIEPQKAIADRYNSRYNTFKQIYPALKPVFDEM